MKNTKSTAGRSVVLIVSIAALAGFLFGYDSAVINDATEAIRAQFEVGSGILGFAVASALIGAAIGAFCGGNLADKHGRILVMKIAAALFLISAVGSGLAPEIISLVVFRVIGGVGMGIASIIAPAYIAEIAPTRVRGRLGSLQQFAIVLGIFFSQLINKLIADSAGSSGAEWLWGLEAWRWMLLVECLPAAAYLVGAYLIPESPRFLVSIGKQAEARRALSIALSEKDVDASLTRIEETLRTNRKPRFSDIRGKVAGLKPIVWAGILLAVFQQLVGINVVFYYSNTLWQSVGFDESQSFIFSLISAAINVTVTIVAIMLVDKVGRKPLLLVGSAGMAVTLGIMGIVFATATVGAGEPILEGIAGPVALVSANLFVVFFGVSWGPVMWVMLGEMFPNKIRGAALAIAGFVQWFANFLVTQTFPQLAEFSLGLAYGLYAAFALISFFLVWKFVRETRGVELEDMVE
ncbi:sugar porter family MFS transporter [Canibacter sp. lx-72]|uniref:sugar porter family MFS transporter n=1 Tax=Canibacter zhuwentaonis TaxID=2837491 RepID=UPI001BDC7D42|nr:sugar porter family MFS transporter [Canibacter zhuwentaonis]MBT1017994.1 sugar porter family MFS transporter [Canibacter zhuwentaonis]